MSSFIRLTNINYLLQDQAEPIEIEAMENDCDIEEIYKLPAKPGDKISWILNKSEVVLHGRNVDDLRIALTNKGIEVAADIATLTETEDQLFIEVTIPVDTVDCEYQLALYSTIDPVDCGQFAGFTIQQLIDSGVTIGQILECEIQSFL